MIQIIPAIDIINGQCVRLTQGDYKQKKVYNEDPLAVAQAFESMGVERLHLVDLDGAKAKHIVNIAVLEKICKQTNLKVDFGGGVKTDDDIAQAFDAGAQQVTAGSIAVKSPETVQRWMSTYGAARIILGADVKGKNIAIHGWQEESDQQLDSFLAAYVEQGITHAICTDVAKDGLLQGSAVDLYQEILEKFPSLKLIASGGVSSVEEVAALEAIGCYGVIIGKAIYEGTIDLKALLDM